MLVAANPFAWLSSLVLGLSTEIVVVIMTESTTKQSIEKEDFSISLILLVLLGCSSQQ